MVAGQMSLDAKYLPLLLLAPTTPIPTPALAPETSLLSFVIWLKFLCAASRLVACIDQIANGW